MRPGWHAGSLQKVKENKGRVSNNQYSFEVQEIELIEECPANQEVRGSEPANTSDTSANSITGQIYYLMLKVPRKMAKNL